MRGSIHTFLAGGCFLAALFLNAGTLQAQEGESRYIESVRLALLAPVEKKEQGRSYNYDFATGDTLLRYRQETERYARYASAPPEKEKFNVSSDRGEGTLLLHGRGTVADLIQEGRMQRRDMDTGNAPRTIELTFIPRAFQGMDADGTLRTLQNRDIPLRFLFRLPPRPLSPGESVQIPLQVPFETAGSILEVGGVLRLTLAGFVTIGGRPCARFDGEIELSQLDPSAGLKGRYSYSVRGASVLFFDLEKRRPAGGRIALRLRTFCETPVSSAVVDGVPRSQPEWSVKEDDIDTLIILEEGSPGSPELSKYNRIH
jgi:hypothetical protein